MTMATHDALRRSLKFKLKLILSENKILVQTIEEYVKKAEAVYRDTEALDKIPTGVFKKAMARLETAYSACIKMVLLAADLFESDKTQQPKSATASKSVSHAPDNSSYAESLRSVDKETLRRLASLEQKFHTYLAMRGHEGVAGGKATDTPREAQLYGTELYRKMMTGQDKAGMYVPADPVIELRRFLYGLDCTPDDGYRDPRIILSNERKQFGQETLQVKTSAHPQETSASAGDCCIDDRGGTCADGAVGGIGFSADVGHGATPRSEQLLDSHHFPNTEAHANKRQSNYYCAGQSVETSTQDETNILQKRDDGRVDTRFSKTVLVTASRNKDQEGFGNNRVIPKQFSDLNPIEECQNSLQHDISNPTMTTAAISPIKTDVHVASKGPASQLNDYTHFEKNDRNLICAKLERQEEDQVNVKINAAEWNGVSNRSSQDKIPQRQNGTGLHTNNETRYSNNADHCCNTASGNKTHIYNDTPTTTGNLENNTQHREQLCADQEMVSAYNNPENEAGQSSPCKLAFAKNPATKDSSNSDAANSCQGDMQHILERITHMERFLEQEMLSERHLLTKCLDELQKVFRSTAADDQPKNPNDVVDIASILKNTPCNVLEEKHQTKSNANAEAGDQIISIDSPCIATEQTANESDNTLPKTVTRNRSLSVQRKNKRRTLTKRSCSHCENDNHQSKIKEHNKIDTRVVSLKEKSTKSKKSPIETPVCESEVSVCPSDITTTRDDQETSVSTVEKADIKSKTAKKEDLDPKETSTSENTLNEPPGKNEKVKIIAHKTATNAKRTRQKLQFTDSKFTKNKHNVYDKETSTSSLVNNKGVESVVSDLLDSVLHRLKCKVMKETEKHGKADVSHEEDAKTTDDTSTTLKLTSKALSNDPNNSVNKDSKVVNEAAEKPFESNEKNVGSATATPEVNLLDLDISSIHDIATEGNNTMSRATLSPQVLQPIKLPTPGTQSCPLYYHQTPTVQPGTTQNLERAWPQPPYDDIPLFRHLSPQRKPLRAQNNTHGVSGPVRLSDQYSFCNKKNIIAANYPASVPYQMTHLNSFQNHNAQMSQQENYNPYFVGSQNINNRVLNASPRKTLICVDDSGESLPHFDGIQTQDMLPRFMHPGFTLSTPGAPEYRQMTSPTLHYIHCNQSHETQNQMVQSPNINAHKSYGDFQFYDFCESKCQSSYNQTRENVQNKGYGGFNITTQTSTGGNLRNDVAHSPMRSPNNPFRTNYQARSEWPDQVRWTNSSGSRGTQNGSPNPFNEIKEGQAARSQTNDKYSNFELPPGTVSVFEQFKTNQANENRVCPSLNQACSTSVFDQRSQPHHHQSTVLQSSLVAPTRLPSATTAAKASEATSVTCSASPRRVKSRSRSSVCHRKTTSNIHVKDVQKPSTDERKANSGTTAVTTRRSTSQGAYSRSRAESRTVCITNLPSHLEEMNLLRVLNQHGYVSKIYFIKHRNTGEFQGTAYVKFKHCEEAESAESALNKLTFDGRQISASLMTRKE